MSVWIYIAIGIITIVAGYFIRFLFNSRNRIGRDAIPLLRSNRVAGVEFQCPVLMKKYVKYRVKVDLSNEIELLDHDSPSFRRFNIQASNIMKCILMGDGFHIERLNSETQAFLDTSNTTWQWIVQPVRRGDQTLFLGLSAQFKVDDQVVVKDIPLTQRFILVKKNPAYESRLFLSKNWQWIIGTIIGTGVVWQVLRLFVFKTH